MKPAKKKTSGPSGAHQSPRRILSASREQLERWSLAAQRAKLAWSQWARLVLDEAADKK